MMYKKKQKKIELDWFKLSQTEYASGIEVYHTSLFFKNDKKKQKFILKHALDEYRHSQYFYNLYKASGKVEKISSPHAIITYGGLNKSPFPSSRKNLINICSYLYIGEIRAIEFVEKVKNQCKDEKIIDIFNIIEKDENNHAAGLNKFLETKNRFLVSIKMKKIKIQFYFSDRKKFKLIARLQKKAEVFFTKLLFKSFPQSIFEIKSDASNFEAVLKNRKRMS